MHSLQGKKARVSSIVNGKIKKRSAVFDLVIITERTEVLTYWVVLLLLAVVPSLCFILIILWLVLQEGGLLVQADFLLVLLSDVRGQ